MKAKSTHCKPANRKVASRGYILLIAMVLLALSTMLTIAAWRSPSSSLSLARWWLDTADRPKVMALGRVQRITYIGGLGLQTQVDTETQSVLLDGVVRLPLHTVIELRSYSVEDEEVCAVGVKRCWRAL